LSLHPVPLLHEPPSAVRQMAAQFFSTYVGLAQDGFTPVEALTLIGYVRGA
jgi:hypothetical protein